MTGETEIQVHQHGQRTPITGLEAHQNAILFNIPNNLLRYHDPYFADGEINALGD